ncbi:hypothetical protein B4U80_14038 [Leptotrombidium deliense]|uniref:Uncharacterized protein n=1 Tax=Leptotrombidium deliense TaxID=299467 RepID=A0A443S4D6_9ACAR|nr:hypothetical protein B4U80_14038 [Leptotrombidium deliense]
MQNPFAFLTLLCLCYRSLLCQNLDQEKTEFCHGSRSLNGATFSLDEPNTVLLFSKTLYWEMDLEKLELNDVKKVNEKFPAVHNVHSVCSMRAENGSGIISFFADSNNVVYYYDKDDGRYKLVHIWNETIINEALKYKNAVKVTDFICYECFHDLRTDYYIHSAALAFGYFHCNYFDLEMKNFMGCSKEPKILLPESVDRRIVDGRKCKGTALDVNFVSNKTNFLYVDEKHVTLYKDKDKHSKRKEVTEATSTTQDTTRNEGIKKK